MDKNNKIISFTQAQKRKKKQKYELKAEISVYIKKNEMSYITDWSSPNQNDTEDSIYIILERIFEDLTKDLSEIHIKKDENYEVNFTLMYYERGKDIKYICIPQEIEEVKLAEYLFTTICIYEWKKEGGQ